MPKQSPITDETWINHLQSDTGFLIDCVRFLMEMTGQRLGSHDMARIEALDDERRVAHKALFQARLAHRRMDDACGEPPQRDEKPRVN